MSDHTDTDLRRLEWLQWAVNEKLYKFDCPAIGEGGDVPLLAPLPAVWAYAPSLFEVSR